MSLWRAPPPNMYRLQAVIGYRNHDYTKKQAPAWSFDRYLPVRRPKPVVSMSPFQKQMLRKMKKRRNWKKGQLAGTALGAKRKADGKRCKKCPVKKQRVGENPSNTEDAVLDEGHSSKERVRGLMKRRSSNSGRFVLHPDDMCEKCFPWAKKQEKAEKPESVDSKVKKSKKSRTSSPPPSSPPPERQKTGGGHTFVIIPPYDGSGDLWPHPPKEDSKYLTSACPRYSYY